LAKNVLVCCDGTGNEFGVRNTNVVRLFQIIEKNTDAQVAYYDPGVGAFGAELLGLATGYGITRNIFEWKTRRSTTSTGSVAAAWKTCD
jgi:uncharacterized protein (DUF2235 family)